jgi:GPH family glycoside/pentoside/hexuronide:cation symporter
MSTLSLVSNVLFMRFMTDSLAIAAPVAAGIFGVGKIWDAVADPLIGSLSDRVTSRFGRRLPWMVTGGVLSPLVLVALYAAPRLPLHALVLYLSAMLIVFATAYTMFMIPYLAMPAEITRSYHGRTQLMAARVIFSALGTILGLGVGPWLLGTWGATRSGNLRMATTLAGTSFLLLGLCLWQLRGAPRGEVHRPQPLAVSRQIISALANRPFFWLMMTKLCYYVALALVLTSLPYFTKYVLHLSDRGLGVLLTAQTLMLIVSQPGWLLVARRFNKRRAFICAGALYGLGCASWWWARPGEPFALVLARIILIGVAGGGVFLTTQAMLPDAIESDVYRTGHHRAGMFTGVFVLIEKLGGAVGVGFIGVFLGARGYLQSADSGSLVQPARALLAIHLCVSFLPAILLGVALLAIRGYRLDAAALGAMRTAAP